MQEDPKPAFVRKVVRQVAVAGLCSTLADLRIAVIQEFARLRVAISIAAINDGIGAVAQTVALVAGLQERMEMFTNLPTQTTLDDLDAADLREERDEICKRLSPLAQTGLMARYGLNWLAQ